MALHQAMLCRDGGALNKRQCFTPSDDVQDGRS